MPAKKQPRQGRCPTLLAAAGDRQVKDRLLKGWQIGDRTFKVHLDGYSQIAYLTGQQDKSNRRGFINFDDDGHLVALRWEDWKFVCAEQKTHDTLDIWGERFTMRRPPLFFNLRMDPYERAEITSNTYWDWTPRKAFQLYGGQSIVATSIGTFKEYPPRQRPQSFTIDQIMEKPQTLTGDWPAVPVRPLWRLPTPAHREAVSGNECGRWRECAGLRLSARPRINRLGITRRRILCVIRNARLDPQWADVNRQTLSIAGRAATSLIQTQGIGDLYRIYSVAQRDDVDFNLASMPTTFDVKLRYAFDPEYMTALFQVGYDMGKAGYPWSKVPPGFGEVDKAQSQAEDAPH